MCVWIREEHAEPRGAGATPPLESTGARRPRSRWAIAGATALVAGLAAAAMVAPSPPTRIVQAAPVPVRAAPATTTQGPVIEQTATSLGDDVPSAPAPTAARAQLGPCDHAM